MLCKSDKPSIIIIIRITQLVGGLGFEFCVFIAGWRHGLWSEWPFITIIMTQYYLFGHGSANGLPQPKMELAERSTTELIIIIIIEGLSLLQTTELNRPIWADDHHHH